MMIKIQKYDLCDVTCLKDKKEQLQMIETLEGDWMKRKDVEPIIERYEKLMNHLVIDDDGIHFDSSNDIKIHGYEWPEVRSSVKIQRCNCAEMAAVTPLENGLCHIVNWWICPAHGYKRR
jgi:hypothetical protein